MGCLESQPLSGAVIQSVFDHSQLLIGDGFHAPLRGNVLAQQTIEVLVAAALPAAIRIGKVGLDAKGLIDGLVIGKLLALSTVKVFTREIRGLSLASIARPTRSAVLLFTLASTAKPLLRSTSVTMACL